MSHYSTIALSVVAALLLIFLIVLRRRAVKRKRARMAEAARLAAERKVYFWRWISQVDRDMLQKCGISFSPGNLEALRQSLTLPPPSPPRRRFGIFGLIKSSLPSNCPSIEESASISGQVAAVDPDEDGIFVTNVQQESALRVLGLNIAATVKTGLETENGEVFEQVVYRRSTSTALSQFKVTFCSGLRTVRKMEPISDITSHLLSACLLTKVEIWDNECPAPAEGVFRVILNGSPSKDNTTHPANVWGLDLGPGMRQAFRPSGQGHVVFAPDGYALAELVGFTLYIHHDLFGAGNHDQAAGLYARILQKLQPELTLTRLLDQVVKEHQTEAQSMGLGGTSNGKSGFSTHISGLSEKTSPRRVEILRNLTSRLLVPAVGQDVLVSHAAGAVEALRTGQEERPFKIALWSSPLGAIGEPAPSTLYGLPVYHADKAFAPSGKGLPLVDNQGFIAGELIDDTLYVHYDLMRYGSLTEARMFARLLLAAKEARLNLLKSDEQNTSEAGEQYVNACLSVVLPLAFPGLDCDKASLDQSQTRLHQLVRQSRQDEQDLFQLEAHPDDELGREFDCLLDVASVVDVKVGDNKLTVTTEVLNCVDPRTGILHEIGAFDIQIPTNGSSDIRWLNRTRKVDGYREGMNAPHVWAAGNACLGNTEALFPKLTAKRDFASAVQVAVAFIEYVNVDDPAGKLIHHWPYAKR